VAHDHAHHGLAEHGGTEASGASSASARQRLIWALGINAVFLVVEVIGGLLSGSLALLADAGHMATDVGALALAVVATYLSASLPTPRRTFGLLRAEVLGAFINGGTLVLVVGWIIWEAIGRFAQSPTVNAPLMLWIGVLGLLANAGSAAVLLGHHKHDVNVRGAFLHLAGDTLGSVGVIIAGVVILLTGWAPIDPLVSILIAVIIFVSTLGLLRDVLGILIHAVPAHLDYGRIKQALEDNAHVELVHDLHIWTISSNITILTAHVRLRPECSDGPHWQQCLLAAQDMLRERFGIVHTTLQLEPPGYRMDSRAV
jgi:cobalt-zinc-cadmium efflux system protein